ncbi:hypothetical protein niasHT_003140 [Heterodera trifolii]|uniref:Uncharacterized protein n=1 Tax=Heterodera trifolii TaxID=157864 RepID=A0ABD2M5S1_9BILA
MDNNLISSHCFSLFLQLQKCTNSNLDAQSAAATAEEEEGRHRQRQLCADRALLLLNRLAHARGLPNVFAKGSTVRPATDFSKINERHHMHLDKLVDKLEDEAATNGPMDSKTASAFSSPFAPSSALRGNGVPNSKFKKRAQRRNARATERCICLLQISTEDTDVLVDEVRDNFGPILATVFADKRIKKVCHGAQERTFLGHLGISHAEPLVDTSGGCRRNLRSLVYEACGVWLNRLAHAQGLPNVFAKDSTVRPATDFFKINERHHMHLIDLFCPCWPSP